MGAFKDLLKWLDSGSDLVVDITDPKSPTVNVNGQLIRQPNSVALALARAVDPSLIGNNPIQEAQVLQWQTWAAEKNKDVFAEVVHLNDHLLNRSFLTGNELTLADLQVYWLVSAAVEITFPGPLGGLVNFSRWFDQVQHSVRINFPKNDISLAPNLVPFRSLYKPLSMPVFSHKKRSTPDVHPHKVKKDEGEEIKGMPQDNPKKNDKGKAKEKAPEGNKAKKEEEAGGKKKEKKAKEGGAPATAAKEPAAADEGGADEDANPNLLEIRVGLITKAWKHPEADKLYCEEIDVGEDVPRQIASGLRHFYDNEADITGRMVLVLANLKPRNMVGFKSHGMVLCASNDDHTAVKFVEVPATAKVGDRVIFPGHDKTEPATPAQIMKKKIFEKLAPGLTTDGQGVANYKGAAFTVESSGEVCTAPLPNSHVS